MTTTIGSSQTSIATAGGATASSQTIYITRFVSEPIYQTSISANTWSLSVAFSESASQQNFPVNGTDQPLRINCYVWRPGGSKVGTILDGTTTSTADESTSERASNVTFSGSSVTIQNGDVIIIELWATGVVRSTSGVMSFFYDGATVTTTDGTVSNHASFLETPENLNFTAAFPVTQESIHKYNIKKNIVQTTIHKYHSRVFAAATASIQKYNILKLVAALTIHKYNIKQLIAGTSIHKYNLRQFLAQTSIQKYNLKRLLAQTSIHKYNLRRFLAQTTIHKYNIFFVGAVLASTIQKYNIRKIVAQTTIQKYSIWQAITRTSVHKYNLRAYVVRSIIHKYGIAGRVLQTTIHKYNIFGIGPISMLNLNTINMAIKFFTKV